MNERADIVIYLREWSAGLLSTAISDYKTIDEWRRLNSAARAICGIADHIENGDHYAQQGNA